MSSFATVVPASFGKADFVPLFGADQRIFARMIQMDISPSGILTFQFHAAIVFRQRSGHSYQRTNTCWQRDLQRRHFAGNG